MFVKKNSKTQYYVIQKIGKHGDVSYLQDKSIIPSNMVWGSDFNAVRYLDMYRAKSNFKRAKASEGKSELFRLMLFDWAENKYINAVEYNNIAASV